MNPRIVIKNAMVLTLDDADSYHESGHVVIEGDRIVAVGAGSPPKGGADDTVIDASGKLVMPGLVDLHYHTALGKGWSDHLPLWEYLDTCWYPIIRALDPEAAYWAALASYSESIKCGVTTVNDMYRQLDVARQRRRRDRHPRGPVQRRRRRRARPRHARGQQARLRAGQRRRRTGGSRSTSGSSGCRSPPTGCCATRGSLADDLGTGIHIHLNESLTEVENSKERFGRRPTEVAYDGGILFDRLHRGALRVALRRRDRADARDRHADLAQPVVEREARQRHRARAGDARRRDQRRARVTTPPSATTAGTCSR